MVEKFVDLVSLIKKKTENKKSCYYLPVLREMGKPSSKTPARRTSERIKKNETRIAERKDLRIRFGAQSHKRGRDRRKKLTENKSNVKSKTQPKRELQTCLPASWTALPGLEKKT